MLYSIFFLNNMFWFKCITGILIMTIVPYFPFLTKNVCMYMKRYFHVFVACPISGCCCFFIVFFSLAKELELKTHS